jgi:hypothetical protein
MKPVLKVAALAGLVTGLSAGLAAGLAPARALAESAPKPAAKMICIDTLRIDRTRVPDARTILFYMDDGTIWKNTLPAYCPGLRSHGFIYSPTPPHRLCSNLETIRVVEVGSVCRLGAFTRYTRPKPAPKTGEQ